MFKISWDRIQIKTFLAKSMKPFLFPLSQRDTIIIARENVKNAFVSFIHHSSFVRCLLTVKVRPFYLYMRKLSNSYGNSYLFEAICI